MSGVFNAYAAYYDLLYKDKDYKKEVDYLYNLMSKYKVNSGRILELGCGTGKHANYLANLGFSVHGIDLSQSMVDIANSVNKSNQVSFSVGDVRSYRHNHNSIFNIVISLFHVASYQTQNLDLLNMFLTASHHLNTGDIFIFDFWYGPAVLSEKPSTRIKRINNKQIEVVRIAEPEMRCNDNIVDVNYDVIVTNKKNKETNFFSETHSMRYLFLPELELILKEADFELVESFPWLGDTKLDLDSWQGVVIAKKIRDVN